MLPRSYRNQPVELRCWYEKKRLEAPLNIFAIVEKGNVQT